MSFVKFHCESNANHINGLNIDPGPRFLDFEWPENPFEMKILRSEDKCHSEMFLMFPLTFTISCRLQHHSDNIIPPNLFKCIKFQL